MKILKRSTLILVILGMSVSAFTQVNDVFDYINIAPYANRGFIDTTAGDGKGGWTDYGSKACFNNMPIDAQSFQDEMIPFYIINPKRNFGKTSIVLSGPQREDAFPKQSKQIKVNRKFPALFFLHTSMYVKKKAKEIVRYKIHYEDGEEVVFSCYNNKEIADWWEPNEFLPNAMRTYEDSKRWLINTPWKNPYPNKLIKWIQMESTGSAIPALVAITGVKEISVYDAFMTKIEKRVKQYELSNLKMAMLQIRSQPNQKLNIDKGTEMCREAAANGADIALFPEMYNIGYLGIDFEKEGAIEKWKSMAVSQESDYVKHFQSLAKELNMAIVITYLEDIGDGKLPRNSATLIDRHGKKVFTYSKVHTCEFAYLECATSPGDDFYVGILDTKAGPVKIGVMICYDREFPESARILMLNGAEIILTPNACKLEELRLSQFRVRAFENAVVTVMTNYGEAEGNERFNGHSCMFDADGREILIAEEEEGVYYGTINIHDVRNYRKETIWGNAFRRPHKYKMLVSPEVDDVFKREDSFGNEFKRLER